MKKALLLSMGTLLFLSGCLNKGPKLKDPKTDAEKTLYTLGQIEARRVMNFGMSEEELGVWFKGVKDALDGKSKKIKDVQAFRMAVTKLESDRKQEIAKKETEASKSYLEKMRKEEGAKVTATGIIIKELKAGEGDSPKKDSMVKVHYHGTLRDGSVFDSSVERGSPATFPLNRVIPCWTETLQTMKVGGKVKVTCPADQAYANEGAPPKIKPGAPLTYDVELLEIMEAPKLPTLPKKK